MRAELQTLHATIPATFSARTRWRSRVSVRLFLSDDDGGIGVGEAAPLPGMSTETAAEARAALAGFDWPDRAPRSAAEISRIIARIDPSTPSARFAAETAMLTLLSCRQRTPLWTTWAETVGETPLAHALWGKNDSQLVESAREAAAHDVCAVKVKVGRAAALDDWLLDTVRSLLPDVELRLDANGTLPPDELDERFAIYGKYNPSFLEEPCSLDQIGARRELPFPIAVDESLAGPGGDARFERALDCKHVGAIVLKPTLLGGLWRCRSMARRAKRAGKRAVISHTMEGPIARAACAHLALALGPHEAAGLGEHPGLQPLANGLYASWIGTTSITPPLVAGLGLELPF